MEEAEGKMEEWRHRVSRDELCSADPAEDGQFSGNALVVLDSLDAVQELLATPILTKNKIEASFGEKVLEQKDNIEIVAAPNPEAILWEQLGVSAEEKAGKKRISHIYALLIIGAVMLIYFLLQLAFGRRLGTQT